MIQRERYWWYSDMEGNKLKQVTLIKKSLIFLPKGKSPQTSLPFHHLILQRVLLYCSLAFEKKIIQILSVSQRMSLFLDLEKRNQNMSQRQMQQLKLHMGSKMARCEHIFEQWCRRIRPQRSQKSGASNTLKRRNIII